jgi:hypothetical protein
MKNLFIAPTSHLVLHLIAVVPVGDVAVVVKVAVGVVSVVAEEHAVIVERAELARVVLRRMVGREVYDDLDAVLVRGRDEVVEGRADACGIDRRASDSAGCELKEQKRGLTN